MPKRNIIIVNDGLGPNKGDQAILQAMLYDIKRKIPSTDIVIFPNSHMQSFRQYWKYWKALGKADLLIFGGGQEIQDHASVAFLISGLLKIILAHLRHRKVLCYALGVGPVGTWLGRNLTRMVLNGVNLITLRDEDSSILLENLRVSKPEIHITADPALTLLPAEESTALEILKREGLNDNSLIKVAIAPRRWFHYGHFILPMSLRSRFFPLQGKERFRKLSKLLADVADYLVNTMKASIVFVPMRTTGTRSDPGQDDDKVSREIIDLMHNKEEATLLQEDYTPAELKGLLGKMDLVISMRMHALVMASMMNVPTLALNISPKFTAFQRMIGQGKYLVDLEEISLQKFITTIRQLWNEKAEIRIELKNRHDALYASAQGNCNYLLQLLKS